MQDRTISINATVDRKLASADISSPISYYLTTLATSDIEI